MPSKACALPYAVFALKMLDRMDYRIFPPEEILETSVALPLSKSMAMRAIAMQWLADATVPEDLLSLCADTAILGKNLNDFTPNTPLVIDCGASGAALRFLIAILSATQGACYSIGGCERLNKRPIKPLVDALRALGASVEYQGEEGFAPVKVEGRHLQGRASIEVDASVSSQIISALMLIAPKLTDGLTICFKGTVQSAPYIKMTADMMSECGISVDLDRESVKIAPGAYSKVFSGVEPDWSAASYWYEIAALTAGWVTLEGLKDLSMQGDRGIAALFERLGVITEFGDEGAELSATPDLYNSLDVDLTDMPDAVPALAITAAMAGIPFKLSGVGALHHKESDRIEALAASLLKLGIVTETTHYGTVFEWDGRRVPITEMPVFDTFGDHRIAMALAPVSVFVPGIVIKNAEVVDKSYPGFWDDLRNAGFVLRDPDENLEEA